MKSALTIAGFDPTGGAGLQADLKVFHNHRVHGLSVVTAITAQNTAGVDFIETISVDFFEQQLHTLLKDIKPDSLKTGMLYSSDLVKSLKKIIIEYDLKNLVIDPVILSSTGKSLIEDKAIDTLRDELFPLAKVITPNIYEALLFTGITINAKEDFREAARIFIEMGPEAVVITGGHFDDITLDIYYDGKEYREIESIKYHGEYHGTGCVFSAAITANLALGQSVFDSTGLAKSTIQSAIKKSYHLGKGMGILDV